MLGGLLTFGFVSPELHIVVGLAVFAIALSVMVLTFVSKPSFKPIRGMSVIIVILLTLQIILGFVTLRSGSQIVAWLHLVNAMVIYGLAIASSFMAIRWDTKSKQQSISIKEP
jgi:heme A synthase